MGIIHVICDIGHQLFNNNHVYDATYANIAMKTEPVNEGAEDPLDRFNFIIHFCLFFIFVFHYCRPGFRRTDDVYTQSDKLTAV